MSDPTSIFGNQNLETPPNNQGLPSNGNPPPQDDQLGALLGMIKNEKGEQKYKNVQEALNALAHSQSYIPQLKNELTMTQEQLREAQEAANKIKELEQVVLQLTQNNTPKANQPSGELSEEKIAELVNATLAKTQAITTQKQNLDTVVNKVREVYGDKADEVFYNKAKELGLSNEQINNLAATSPTAALTMLGIGSGSKSTVSTPGINTTNFAPRQDTKITVNKESVMSGATSYQVRDEASRAKEMVDELHAQGLSTYDLTDPKQYRKYFNLRK